MDQLKVQCNCGDEHQFMIEEDKGVQTKKCDCGLDIVIIYNKNTDTLDVVLKEDTETKRYDSFKLSKEIKKWSK